MSHRIDSLDFSNFQLQFDFDISTVVTADYNLFKETIFSFIIHQIYMVSMSNISYYTRHFSNKVLKKFSWIAGIKNYCNNSLIGIVTIIFKATNAEQYFSTLNSIKSFKNIFRLCGVLKNFCRHFRKKIVNFPEKPTHLNYLKLILFCFKLN